MGVTAAAMGRWGVTWPDYDNEVSCWKSNLLSLRVFYESDCE